MKSETFIALIHNKERANNTNRRVNSYLTFGRQKNPPMMSNRSNRIRDEAEMIFTEELPDVITR
jgi:hypothetical protein